MSPSRLTMIAAAMLLALSAFAQQDDLYSRITPLEQAVNSGTATPAQQLELARLYSRAGRFYEAKKIADQLVAASPNDADAASVRDDAARGLRDMQSKKVAEAEANAKRSGATDQDRRALADAYF